MNRLTEIRTMRGMTQQQLAEKSGIHRVTIARLESGSRPITGITLATAIALADALGVTPVDLVRPNP